MTHKITYARHGAAAAVAGAVVSLLGAIGLELDPDTVGALVGFIHGVVLAIGLAVYAAVEKYLKRWTGED